jgi:ectoine hydroxylase-related dioxygenase (phytanoyl-CoA dioxygenase family)
VFPEVCEVARHPFLKEFIAAVLGPNAGMVRALYFDKPPDRSWSLPWHRDRTIAVKNNAIPSSRFCKPTFKAGIPHVEAPEAILASMLTVRVHLDAMVAENGPLSVIPGSHRLDEETAQRPIELSAAAGDVLAMRPLLSHSSSVSHEGTTMHRRVIHLEFAPCSELPDGYEWYSYTPIA